MSTPPRIRPAARAIVVDPDRRVLLVHFAGTMEPGLANGWWACPGGGIDPGETVTQGLVRELDEELGLRIDDPGSPVWRKQHLFHMTHWDGQHDTYFLIEVGAFEPAPRYSLDELRAEGLDDLRWWTHDELVKAQAAYDAGDPTAAGYAAFSPSRLIHLLTDLLESGRPPEPIVLEGR
ncbi:MAG: NUDIX domain-containing protein [Nocardioidaceae bacterium]